MLKIPLTFQGNSHISGWIIDVEGVGISPGVFAYEYNVLASENEKLAAYRAGLEKRNENLTECIAELAARVKDLEEKRIIKLDAKERRK